ncbi:MAG: WXG100 family type VII secretion target [Actinopolymorphaceae bacterium]
MSEQGTMPVAGRGRGEAFDPHGDPVRFMAWLVDKHLDLLPAPVRATWPKTRELVRTPGDAQLLRQAAQDWDGGSETSDASAYEGSAYDGTAGSSLGTRLTTGRTEIASAVTRLLESWEGTSADALQAYHQDVLGGCFETLGETCRQIARHLRTSADAVESFRSGLRQSAVAAVAAILAATVSAGPGQVSGAALLESAPTRAVLSAVRAFAEFAAEAAVTYVEFRRDSRVSLRRLHARLLTFDGTKGVVDGTWPRPGGRLASGMR